MAPIQMNSWETIKAAFVQGKTPGLTGYLWPLTEAANLYCSIRLKLRDIKASDKSFNDDTEVTQAMLMRGQLEALKKL